MINPAQYNQVLQKASDEQLMQMLRRPDKIPSQFIVSEINRRQHMRQASQAQQRQQAQQMAQPQQMPAVGMNTGGNPIMAKIDALADRGDIQSLRALTTDPMVVRSYGLPVRKYAQEKLASLVGPQTPSIFQKVVNNVKDTQQDTGLSVNDLTQFGTISDLNMPTSSENSEASSRQLSPADINANIMAERREEYRQSKLANMPTSSTRTNASQSPAQGTGLSVNDLTQFGANSDLNMSGMNQIASKYLANAPTSVRTDTSQSGSGLNALSPAEINANIMAESREEYRQAQSANEKARQEGMARAEQASRLGETGSKSMNMVNEAVRSGILSQAPAAPENASVTSSVSARRAQRENNPKENPISKFFQSLQTTSSGGQSGKNKNQADNTQLTSPVGETGSKSMDMVNEATRSGSKNAGLTSVGNNQNTTQTSTTQSSKPSNSNLTINMPSNSASAGLSTLASDTASNLAETSMRLGQTTTGDSFNDKANAIITEALNIGKDDIEATDTKENAGGGLNNAKQGQTSLEIFEGTVEENQELRKAIQNSVDTFSGEQKENIKNLQAQSEKIFAAEEALAKAYESNTDKPENRIWKSLITAGLDLATTNEANFFQALGNAGKQGIATFDALNQEAKDNLMKKYESAVNLERSKMDVMAQIQNMQNEVTKTQIASQTALAESQMAENLGKADALQADRDYQLQQDQLAVKRSLGERGLELQALGIELDGYRLIADNLNAKDRNRIQEIIANKPPAEVAVINHIVKNKDEFGLSDSDVTSLVMGNKTSDTKTPWNQIIPSATTQAESAMMNQPPIPNVDPQGKDGEYTMSQYVNYYTQLMVAQFSGTTPSMVNTSGTSQLPPGTRVIPVSADGTLPPK